MLARLIKRLCTWWNSQTLGTQIYTWRHGRKVGEDASGCQYYQNADGTRRWVIYCGYAEASRVPPEWHGWLHHTSDALPDSEPGGRQPWQIDHQENQTGSATAYVPAGSLRRSRPTEPTDYEAWNPGR